MIRFLVKFNGEFVDADKGTVMPNGSLHYTVGDHRDYAGPADWRLHPDTIADPAFKQACWAALGPELQAAAIERRPALGLRFPIPTRRVA